MTVRRSAALAERSCRIAGKATLVTEPSTKARLEARIDAARVQPGAKSWRAPFAVMPGLAAAARVC